MSFKIWSELKEKKQCSIYHFTAYETLFLNTYFLKGLVYFPGDMLDTVLLGLNEKFDLTEKFRYFPIFSKRKVQM